MGVLLRHLRTLLHLPGRRCVMPNLNIDITPAWAPFRRGDLDAEEIAAAITVCDRALLACPQWDMAAADAIGLLDMLGLYRPQEPS